MIKIKRIIEYGLYLLIFLLPWQTRYVFRWGEMNGRWEYGDVSIYSTDILLGILLVLALIWLGKCQMSNVKCQINDQCQIKNPACAGRQELNPPPSSRGRWTTAGKQIPNCQLPITDYRLPITKLWRLIALFEFIIFLSTFWSQDKTLAIYGWLRVLAGISLFWLLLKIKFDWQKIIYVIIFSGIIQSILGIYQFISQSTFASKWLGMAEHVVAAPGTSVVEFLDQRWLRVYGALPHPNILAGFLVVCFLLLIGLAVSMSDRSDKGNKGGRIIVLIGLLTILPALFFTFSRGAWLALVVSCWLLVVGLLVRRKEIVINWKMLGQALVLVLVLVTVLSIIYHDLITTRISGVERLEIKSNLERINTYQQALTILSRTFPWGAGINNYSLVLHNFLNPNLESWSYQPVHNVFVLILSEIGIVGLILFLLIIGWALMSNSKCQIPNVKFQMSDEQYRLKNPVCAGRQEPNSKFPAFAPATAGRQMSNCKLQTTGDRLPITDYQLLITKILKFILLTVLIIMLFDHYFWTMSFGIYLFWLILGLNQAINNQSSS